MDTLTRMQRHQYEYQRRVREIERTKAARYIRRHSKRYNWDQGELQDVLEMLGLVE